MDIETPSVTFKLKYDHALSLTDTMKRIESFINHGHENSINNETRVIFGAVYSLSKPVTKYIATVRKTRYSTPRLSQKVLEEARAKHEASTAKDDSFMHREKTPPQI